MKYNLNELSFLIGSFRDVVNTWGQDHKSVAFYKRQVDGLVAINQIDSKSAKLVERIIGMENTDSVKWEQANKKLDMFVYAIESTMNIDDTSKKTMLSILVKNGSITETVRDIVNEVYGITTLREYNTNKSSFGKLQSSKREKNSDITDNPNQVIIDKLLNLKVSHPRGSSLVIKVRNPNAVCSGDVFYYTEPLSDVIIKLKKGETSLVINALAESKNEYEIGEERNNPDPCRGGKIFTSTVDTKTLGIDWRRLQ